MSVRWQACGAPTKVAVSVRLHAYTKYKKVNESTTKPTIEIQERYKVIKNIRKFYCSFSSVFGLFSCDSEVRLSHLALRPQVGIYCLPLIIDEYAAWM
jgi:hypothetical protein